MWHLLGLADFKVFCVVFCVVSGLWRRCAWLTESGLSQHESPPKRCSKIDHQHHYHYHQHHINHHHHDFHYHHVHYHDHHHDHHNFYHYVIITFMFIIINIIFIILLIIIIIITFIITVIRFVICSSSSSYIQLVQLYTVDFVSSFLACGNKTQFFFVFSCLLIECSNRRPPLN